MFNLPRPKLIDRYEGFSVEVLGWTGLLYTEGASKQRGDLAGIVPLFCLRHLLYGPAAATITGRCGQQVVGNLPNQFVIDDRAEGATWLR